MEIRISDYIIYLEEKSEELKNDVIVLQNMLDNRKVYFDFDPEDPMAIASSKIQSTLNKCKELIKEIDDKDIPYYKSELERGEKVINIKASLYAEMTLNNAW